MKLVRNMSETIRSQQWTDKDKDLSPRDLRIAAGWGLCQSDLDGLRRRVVVCRPTIPVRWTPPPSPGFKVNFDGASRGNPSPTGFGGVCRTSSGIILKIFFGYIGHDSNNSAELEGLIQGLLLIISKNWFPVILEGDSLNLVQMETKLLYGQSPEKVSSSWRLLTRLEILKDILANRMAISFAHVKREANKVADLLANHGIESGNALTTGFVADFPPADWVRTCGHLAEADLARSRQQIYEVVVSQADDSRHMEEVIREPRGMVRS